MGINGFGRIGRDVLRAAFDRADTDLEIVAVDDLTTPETPAHLLAYDSTYGPWSRAVGVVGDTLTVGGRTVRVTAHADPAEVDWDVDLVIEATGRFRTREAAAAHLAGSAQGDHHRTGQGRRRHHRDGRQRRGLRPRTAPRGVQRLLHDQLRRAHGDGVHEAFGIKKAS